MVTTEKIFLPHAKRTEHLAILGRTGSGKSTLLRSFAFQDIRERRGFMFFDLHGDATPLLLQCVASEEQSSGTDLSARLVVVEPADCDFSVGLNVLEHKAGQESFVQVAEVSAILRQRWGLESFGPRTDELLRNALHAVSENGLTLLEVALLLVSAAFRAECLKRISNPEIRSYFETRYNTASPAMQATLASPVLNKLTAFTADPHFRHILGQQRSTISITEAMDRGMWILVNLEKGKLGEQAITLGSLFLAKAKNALFSRRSRRLFTLYCDELQNLVHSENGMDVLLSEARKFGIGVASANQFLDQYPVQMRAAVLSIGTHMFFQLSSADAQHMAAALDGGKPLAELLKNLPQRQFVLKTGHEPWQRVLAPSPEPSRADYADLRRRSLARWARRRSEVEQEIRSRRAKADESQQEVLRDWE